MGWSSGSELADDIYSLVREFIPKNKRRQIAYTIYDKFCDHDADDWCGETQLEKDANVIEEQ